MSDPALRVERLHPGDEDRLRSIRLRALAADPDAFYRTLAEEEPQPREFWTRWLTAPGQGVLVVRQEDRDVALGALSRTAAHRTNGRWWRSGSTPGPVASGSPGR